MTSDGTVSPTGHSVFMYIGELIAQRDRLIEAAKVKNRRIRELEKLVRRYKLRIRKRDERLAAYRNSDPEVQARARNGQLYSYISKALGHLTVEDTQAARELLVEALRLTPEELDDLAFKARTRLEERRRAGEIKAVIRGPGTSDLLRGRIKPSTRKRIFARDAHRCRQCSHVGDEHNPLTIDHIIPISHGGTNDDRNLQTLCQTCNLRKNKLDSEPNPPIDLDKYEIRLVPRRKPRQGQNSATLH